MKFLKTVSILGVSASLYYGIRKLTKTEWRGVAAKAGMVAGMIGLSVLPAYAMNEASVRAFGSAISTAANSQNIGQVAQLIDDEAVISLSRQGKAPATLDKDAYLQLLQKSWAGAKNYHYQIELGDVVITGNQAKVQVKTVETWQKDGKSIKLITNSRATLTQTNKDVVLLRAVSQITIE